MLPAAANPTFRVTLGRGPRPAQEYIARVLLGEFLGLDVDVSADTTPDATVSVAAGDRELRLPQTLLGGGIHLPRGISPTPPLPLLDVEAAGFPPGRFCGPQLPVLFGSPQRGGWLSRGDRSATLHADVLGGSFFMLTRLEEVDSPERDEYGCFPVRSSLAWREGFLRRPIVNEYAELLWLAMSELWPGLKRPTRRFSVRVSHDVDRPRAYADCGLRDRFWVVRHHAHIGLLPPLRGSRLWNALRALLGLSHRDPFDTFDELMASDESAGLRATFNFLCGGTHRYDGHYDVRNAPMRRLLRAVHSRGHVIGLHGSYETIEDAPRLAAERERLLGVLREEAIPADVVEGRQHYLRWRAPLTWRIWDAAGLRYDSSLGFYDTIGFRCGTCYEYPTFDVVEQRPLRLRERPLHVMDVALPEDFAAARAEIDSLRQAVTLYDGVLEVLWHNNTLAELPGSAALHRHAMAGA